MAIQVMTAGEFKATSKRKPAVVTEEKPKK